MNDSSRKTLDMNWMEKEVATGRGEAGASSCIHQQAGQPKGAGCGHGASCGPTAAGAVSSLSVRGGASLPHVTQQAAPSVRNAGVAPAGAPAASMLNRPAVPPSASLATVGSHSIDSLLVLVRAALQKDGINIPDPHLKGLISNALAFHKALKETGALDGGGASRCAERFGKRAAFGARMGAS